MPMTERRDPEGSGIWLWIAFVLAGILAPLAVIFGKALGL